MSHAVKENVMDKMRRKLLLSALFGAGGIGLRTLATGLPLSLLAPERTANADPPPACVKPQFLFYLTSGSGDPLNANVPGCYTFPGIVHPADPAMAPMSLTLGGKPYTAARPWAELPAPILARTSFLHHGTYSNSHGDSAKVKRLQGAIQRQEMLVSLIGKSLAPCLGTVQRQPLVLGGGGLVTFDGAVMPTLTPIALESVLASPTGPLANLQKIRDTNLDRLNALFKESGTIAQRNLLDKYALSQKDARSLSDQLLGDLALITGATRIDINIAAAALFKMNVSPVVVSSFSFGGDNHTDPGLEDETANTVSSVAALADFQTRLAAYGLGDKVTIAIQNVFGRTLGNGANGRNHHAAHHCTVMIGANVKSSVIGGTAPIGGRNDFRATGIDSTSGQSNDAGDVPYPDTLGAVGKTVCAAVGVPRTVLDEQITRGKVIGAALA